MIIKNKYYLLTLMLITACGGGGGGGGDDTTGGGGGGGTTPTPTPTATLSSSTGSVEVNTDFTLTWSSTNATACTASGAWSDSIGTSGTKTFSESTTGTKIYSITCTGAGGSASDSATVTINPVQSSDTAFNGFAIDGYISGANIFIDQNFNFKQDDGEYTAVTNTDGSFTIETNDEAVFACLKKRPIVADVLVGAVDSTLGGVTEAYQMILPSVEDAGTNTIVISPFTSLFAEAIITGKNDSELSEDLTLTEGCESKGDTVATNISTAITELKNSIEANFGITYDQLLGDFVANSTNEKVTEEVAQKIAAFFPYYKLISDTISNELSDKYNKEVNPNISLSQNALDAIFSSDDFNELPLEFYSIYITNPNSEGFYNRDEIYATGAKIQSEGALKRYLCTLSDVSKCTIMIFLLMQLVMHQKNLIGK